MFEKKLEYTLKIENEEPFPTSVVFAFIFTRFFNDFSRCRFNAFDIADTVKNSIETIQESIFYLVNMSFIEVFNHEAYKRLYELKL